MKVEYKSDLYAGYLQVEVEAHINRKDYIFQMLEENSIPGILPMHQRMEEGYPYLYLDITSKQSLVQEYREKDLQLEELVALLQELIRIFEELRNYLLPSRFLLLQPEYVYRDTDSRELFLALIPWEREEDRGFQPLAEFFLEKMSPKDEHGINLVYQLYRQQSDPGFSLYRFMTVAERESILKRQKGQEEISISIPEEKSFEEEVKPSKKESILHRWFSKLFTWKKEKKNEESYGWELVSLPENQETVFFEGDHQKTWNLQWKERGKNRKAEIKELPFTVGKLRQEVSLVIEDPSVSRIHCRFIEQDMGVGVMDMNSTNGTFLNGLRLKPGEIMGIEKNDEILVGKVRVLVV